MEELHTQNRRFPVGLVLAAVLLLILALGRILPELREEKPEPALQQETVERPRVTEATVYTGPRVEFPCLTEDGTLQIHSLFQYSGINPDCSRQEGSNIAAVRLSNVSDSYLASGTLTMLLQDGNELRFSVTDLPVGSSAMVFSQDNLTLEAGAVCTAFSWEPDFSEPDAALREMLSVTVEEITVTVTNLTEQDLDHVVVYCRSRFGDDYFGGITYMYTIEQLPAGGTAKLEAWDCLPGTAEVVRIAINES